MAEFYPSKKHKCGHMFECRSCRAHTNKEASLKYYYKNKAKRDAEARHYSLIAKYGITAEDYDEIYEGQHGRCAICGIHSSSLNMRLAVDHNHVTGNVRGLLCGNCNIGLGKFQEDIDIFKKAIEYLNIK